MQDKPSTTKGILKEFNELPPFVPYEVELELHFSFTLIMIQLPNKLQWKIKDKFIWWNFSGMFHLLTQPILCPAVFDLKEKRR
jgi:hypothetical protein